MQFKAGDFTAVALSPNAVAFDRTLPGATSPPTTFRLSNLAGSSVAVSGVALASADFVLGTDACSGKAVAVGAACTFQASFRPASVGTKSANVVITDNGPGSPRTVVLTGRGVANQVAGRVVGRKVDGTSAPLVGAQVAVRSGTTTVATVSTDADGKYAIPLEDGTYQVTFTAPADSGYAPLQQSVEVPTSGSLDAVLIPKDALRLSGTIRSPLGVPVKGVRVVVDDNAAGAQTTGVDGAYAAAVARGDHRITLSADGLDDDSLPDRWSLPLDAITVSDDRAALDLTLPAVYALTTRVLTTEKDPLPGASVTGLQLPVAPAEVAPGVTISATAVTTPASATTDAKGLAHTQVFASTAGHGTVAATQTTPATTFPVPGVTRDTTVSVRADGSATPIVSYLTGTVHSAAGQALPGVKVTATGADAATTIADGTFQTVVDAGSHSFELDADEIQQAGLPKNWTLPTGALSLQSDRAIDFVLPPVHTLTVRVLDGNDQPVNGAIVTGLDGGAALDLPVAPTQIASGLTTTATAHSRPASATTGSDGTARFRLFPNTAGQALVLPTDGHKRATFAIPAASGDTTVIVHVETPPTRTVRGVVRSASGTPVAGVQVAIGGHSARSDTDGTYAISDIPPDRYAIFLTGTSLPGLPQSFQLRSTPVDIDSDTTLDWTLPAVHTLTLKVTDDTGTPLEGAAIGNGALTIPAAPGQLAPGIAIDSGYSATAITTDSSGIATQRAFTSTPTSAHVAPLGPYAPTDVVIPALDDDRLITVSVSRQSLAKVHGVVRSASGTPVAGVQVAIGGHSARTDSDGSYSISDIAPDRYATFLTGTSLPGLPQTFQLRSTPVDIDSDTTLDWTLPAVHALTLKVTDDTGTPLEGAAIGNGALTIPAAPSVAFDSGYSATSATTDTTGAAAFLTFNSTTTTAHIAPLGGRYLAKDVAIPAVTSDRSLTVRFTSDDLNPDPDHATPDLPRGVSGHVVGRSLFGTSVPLSGVRVDIRRDGTTIATTATNASGDYAVTVVDGTYDVRFTPAEASLYAPLTQHDVTVARAYRSDVVLTPNDAVRVDGTVRTSTGEPVRDVNVTLSGDTDVNATTAADGTFVAAVSAGSYELQLTSGSKPGLPANWTLHTKAIDVQTATTLDLALPAVRALSLKVLKSDDSPLAGAQISGLLLPVARVELAPGVTTTQLSQSGVANVVADTSGSVTVPVFTSSPAAAEIAAGPENPHTLFQIPSISADTTLTVRADGAARSKLAGVVRAAAGRAVEGASVTLDGPEHSTQSTGDDGSYAAAVTPGSYQLTVAGGEAGLGLPGSWSLPLETTSVHSDRTVDVDLPAVHTLTIEVRDTDDHPLSGAVISGLSLPVAASDVAPGLTSTGAARSGPGTVVTGSDGTVSLQVFSSTPASAEIAAGAANPTTRFEIPSIARDIKLTVRANGLTRVRLDGKVTTAGGTPVAGVATSVSGPDAIDLGTDLDGSFTAAVTPGVYQLRLGAPVAAPAGLPLRWTLPLAATSVQADRDLTLALPAVHQLRLRVLGADDQPLAGAKLTGLELPVAAHEVAPGILTSGGTSGTAAATTDTDGVADVLVFTSEAGSAQLAAGPANPRVTFDVPAVSDDTSVTMRIADHVDVVAPHVVCAARDSDWHPDDVTVPCTAEDGGSGLARPEDASFELRTSVPAGTETASAATDTRQVCDGAGNCVTAGPITRLKVDRRAPDPICAAPTVAWSAADAAIVCTPRDAGSGLAAGVPTSFVLHTATSPGTEDPAAASDSRALCDAVGNCTTAGPFAAHVDRRPPTISCVQVACRAADAGVGLANLADAAFTLGAGESREVCDALGNCATAGPYNVSLLGRSGTDADADGTPDNQDFCPDRAGACAPAVPGATAQDRAVTTAIAARAIATACGTSAWGALADRVRRKAGSSPAGALEQAGSAICTAGVVAFAVADSARARTRTPTTHTPPRRSPTIRPRTRPAGPIATVVQWWTPRTPSASRRRGSGPARSNWPSPAIGSRPPRSMPNPTTPRSRRTSSSWARATWPRRSWTPTRPSARWPRACAPSASTRSWRPSAPGTTCRPPPPRPRSTPVSTPRNSPRASRPCLRRRRICTSATCGRTPARAAARRCAAS